MNSVGNTGNKKNFTSFFKKSLFWIFFIIFLFVIVYIIYFAWYKANLKKQNEPIIISDIIDSNVSRSGKTVPTPTEGMTQSVSTWIYVKGWEYNFGRYKNILWKGSQDSASPRHSPSLWLYPLTNNLKVLTSVESTEGVESCDINNIPLMKWVHIAYVLNNRTVDIYINGKLERSCALKGVPIIKEDQMFITTGDPAGYYGKIGKTQYFTRALQQHEVVDIYNSGPIGSSQYNIQFFKDGNIMKVTNNEIAGTS
jgi:hypothetical protein